MSMTRAWPLEVAVFERVTGALEDGLEVFNFTPTVPPDRWARIDGFTGFNDDLWKQQERTQFGFIVHVFDKDAKSKAWVVEQITLAHIAITSSLLDGAGDKARLEAYTASYDPQPDNGKEAHAMNRYSIRIGV